jgi:hypothetical protein
MTVFWRHTDVFIELIFVFIITDQNNRVIYFIITCFDK